MTHRSAPASSARRAPRAKPAPVTPPSAPAAAADGRTRCGWVTSDPLYLAYHDEEWGLPLHDERALFELLILEGAQAGLSWITILRKRARYRELFEDFELTRVARFDARRLARLMTDPGIVRNAAKLKAAVQNAQACLRLIEEQGSFDRHLWSFVGGQPRVNRFTSLAEVPAATTESQALSRDLRRRGFNFVGPTICYAFMQAAGLVNDHVVGCFRHREVQRAR